MVRAAALLSAAVIRDEGLPAATATVAAAAVDICAGCALGKAAAMVMEGLRGGGGVLADELVVGIAGLGGLAASGLGDRAGDGCAEAD